MDRVSNSDYIMKAFSSNRLISKFEKKALHPDNILYNNNAKYLKIKRIKVKSPQQLVGLKIQ